MWVQAVVRLQTVRWCHVDDRTPICHRSPAVKSTATMLLSLLLAACSTSRHETPRTARDGATTYAEPAWWVCRPDLPSDTCRGDLSTTEITATGEHLVEAHLPAQDSDVDCFYVYPTVDLSLVPGNHVDFSDLSKIRAAASAQIARFSEVCNVYAPLYRQATIATYFSTQGDQATFFEVAYSDIAAAFAVYRAQFAKHHRLVIIGHSQGSQMAARLLHDVIEPDPALRATLLVAMPIGFTVDVPNDRPTGGTFRSLAACTSAAETGCLVSYLSIAEGDKPNKLTNKVPDHHHAMCVAPASGPTLRLSVFPSAGMKGITTPYVAVRDFYRAQCTLDPDGRNYLAVAEVGARGDPRPHLLDLSKSMGGLGLHKYDLQLTQGDLIELIRTKARSRNDR
ncbi:DUF3089 domain-containing protein [soil metagenome]